MEHNEELYGTQNTPKFGKDLEGAKEYAQIAYNSMQDVLPDLGNFHFVWEDFDCKIKDLNERC